MSRLLTFLLLAAALRPAEATEKPFAFGTVRFEENRGQADASVRYLARARGQQVFLTDQGVLFSPPGGAAVHMQFDGAAKSHWTPDGPASDSISYYIGNDPAKWVKAVPVFDRIVWRDVYPGVDVAFYGRGDHLEYDLVVAPRADLSRIRIQFDSSSSLRTSADGTVEVSFGGSVMRQRTPDIWQETSVGKRRKIAGRFVAAGKNGLLLALSRYQRSRTLVVDPVLEMATYLGGENDDEVVAIADGVVAGNTRSVAFPANNPTLRMGRDVFIRGTGPAMPNQPNRNTFYGTVVIGGSGDDELAGVAVSSIDSGIYLAGTTRSTDFPATRTSQYHGGASDGFVALVSTQQYFSSLSYAFYVGGSGEDRINGFAGNGSVMALAGVTDSADLSTTDVPQMALAGGKDAFYGIISPFSGQLAVLGYLGGSGDDAAYAVAVRNSGSVWIGGETRSSDFPSASGGLAGPSDAFLAEVSTPSFLVPAPSVQVTTYRIGGNGEDSIRALVAAPSTNTASVGGGQFTRPFTVDGIGFAGITTSTDLPVRNAAQPQPGGDRDGFVGMWDRAGAVPRWLTYLGGSGPDEATAIAQNWAGDLYVGGWTGSADLRVVQALQPAPAGGEDGMFAVFDYAGGLQHLTYFGGSGDDRIRAVGVIFSSVARVAGSSTSTDLPQRLAWQDRGGRADGFVADIGSDYFLGPTELALAKDGLLYFAVRPGRTAFRDAVTYRSADPSRVRLVYLGRSFDQVTAAAEENIAVEALEDHGEVDVTVSASGYNSKIIRVKLYPGAFIPAGGPGANPISTWSSPFSVFAGYYVIDPATSKPLVSMALRDGAPTPVSHWSLSDPTVFELTYNNGSPQLQALKPGNAVLSLTVDGYQVLQGDQTFTAATPRPVPPVSDFHLGRDLSATLPIYFALNGIPVTTGFRGTLSARSGDLNRLLLSLASDQPGRDQVSLVLSNRWAIYAQALADDGPVQVFLTSSEFDGEIPINVILEPTVLRWGSTSYVSSGTVVVPSVSLTANAQSTGLTLSLQSQSGSGGSLRPGASPLILKLSNSNPAVVEVNRLTVTMGSSSGYTLIGLAAGSSDLALTSSSDRIQPAPATVHVDVHAAVPILPTFPSSYYVGSGLQTPVTFRYNAATPGVMVVSNDPTAVLVASAATVRGSDHATLQASNSGDYTFYLQGLKSTGGATVRVQFPEGERAIPVVLLPSGIGFSQNFSLSLVQGFDQSTRAVAFALDRDTGIGVFQQIPQPGPGIAVHFRSDGAPVKLDRDSAVLTADAPQATLDYTLPPAGQRATLIVDGSFATSPLTSTLKVGSTLSSDPVNVGNLVLARGELRQYAFGSNSAALTITSGDPQRVLVSVTATDPPAPAIQLPKSTFGFYIHALGDSGVVTLRVDSPDATPSEIKVGLQPLQFNVSNYNTSVPLGGTADFSASLNAYTLRPDAGPFHFTARSTNPSVATVSPGTFDTGSPNSTFAGKLQVTGVSPGTTQLIIEGPPDVYTNPANLTITVAPTRSEAALPVYTIGKNLQGSTQIDLGASFANPNGAIVTLTSSDPSLLLLSRSSSTPGTASAVVAAPAGDHRTQLIYLQAVGEGSATIQAIVNGSTLPAATVHIAPSWVSCGAEPISIPSGSTQTLSCFARYDAGSSSQFQDLAARAGLADVTIGFASSDPNVFTVSPASLSLQSGGNQVTLHGVTPGAGALQVTPPSAFGPSPDGSETVAVTVVHPALTSSCGEMALGKDTEVTCTVSAAAGTVTATSQDPALLLISSDPKIAGSATATAVSNGQSVSFTLQGLGSYGTVEAVFTAPGYQALRVAVALRPSEFNLSASYPSPPISLRIGGIATLSVAMRTPNYIATPRAGANIAIDLSTDQPGIVSLSPAHIVFNGPQSTGNVQVQGKATGSTLVRMAVPAGFLATGTPIAVSVTPQ
jgi:hypothetical protein